MAGTFSLSEPTIDPLTELLLGKADWPEWGSLLKSPIWSAPAFATLRQRMLNP